MLGSAADLRGETAQRATQDGVLDILVIDDPSLDPEGVCHALGERHILHGERGLPGALAHCASRRATAVLVGEPTSPVPLQQWADVTTHVLSVQEHVESEVRPERPAAVLNSNSAGSRALEVMLNEHGGLARVDAPAGFPPPALPQRPNVFTELSERAGMTARS